MIKIKFKHILIPLIYSGIFFLTDYFGNNTDYLSLFLFAIGVILGVVLMYLDELFIHKYYLEKNTVKINLMTRSLLFIFSLFPLGLFIMTSTGSESGIGLFLGISTILFLELLEHRKDVDSFHSRFMFQLKRRLSTREINYFVASFGGVMSIFVLFVFFFGR